LGLQKSRILNIINSFICCWTDQIINSVLNVVTVINANVTINDCIYKVVMNILSWTYNLWNNNRWNFLVSQIGNMGINNILLLLSNCILAQIICNSLLSNGNEICGNILNVITNITWINTSSNFCSLLLIVSNDSLWLVN
jgi:hypothetical protein